MHSAIEQRSAALPRHLRWLLAGYTLASFAHFTHNAEYIALYPNMPAWLGREHVYLAWLAVVAVGLLGGWIWLRGWRLAAAATLAVYGFLGLDGLAHYTLALCSEHSLAMNVTIWCEAMAGLAVAAAAARLAAGRARRRAWKGEFT